MLAGSDTPQSIADQALDCERLRSYLRRNAYGFGELGPLRATRLVGGRSNLTYLVTDEVIEFVLRRPPLGTLTPRAYDIAREFRMMDALGRRGVRVPVLRHLCDDASIIGATFLVMDRVHGTVLRDAVDVAGVSAAHRRLLVDELLDALVELHAVDAADLLPDAHRRGAQFVERQVRRWSGQWRLWQTRDLPAVDALGARLMADAPVTQRIGVVHGDFRFDNVMFDDGLRELTAIFDWELSAIGDPLADLGLLLAYWATDGSMADLLPHKRLTAALAVSPDDIAQRYARTTGVSLEHLEFYIALGYFKWAVIREGVFRRQSDGAMPDEDGAAIGASVQIIAEHGLEIATGSGI